MIGKHHTHGGPPGSDQCSPAVHTIEQEWEAILSRVVSSWVFTQNAIYHSSCAFFFPSLPHSMQAPWGDHRLLWVHVPKTRGRADEEGGGGQDWENHQSPVASSRGKSPEPSGSANRDKRNCKLFLLMINQKCNRLRKWGESPNNGC